MDRDALIDFLIACETGDLERAKINLGDQELPDTSAIDAGWTPLMRTAGWGNSADLVTYLIQKGAKLDAEEPEMGYSALACAAEEGNTNVIETLVSLGCKIDHQDFDGQTALMAAIISNQLEAMKCLIALGASSSITDNDGRTPREIAFGMDYDSIVDYFNL